MTAFWPHPECNVSNVALKTILLLIYNNSCCYVTYENKGTSSPLTTANNNGVPTQVGTKYNRAGCAALKMCIIAMVVPRPII